MNLEHRLRALARAFGCPQHGEPLFCPACDPLPPTPQVLDDLTTRLIDDIVERVGVDTLRTLLAPVPRPPVHDVCPRCGAARWCLTCGELYGKRLFAAVGLTPDEHARLGEILAWCRTLEP